MNVNLKGVWYGCKHAVSAMRNNPMDAEKGLHVGGSIINTASFVALRGAATPQLAYTASKGAVLAMTRELSAVHAREGIRFNSLCPGPLRTPLLMDFLDTPAKRDRRLVHVPMGRFGEAVEQARAVLFLASDESSYMTGTDLNVDGGLCSAYVVSSLCAHSVSGISRTGVQVANASRKLTSRDPLRTSTCPSRRPTATTSSQPPRTRSHHKPLDSSSCNQIRAVTIMITRTRKEKEEWPRLDTQCNIIHS